MPYIRELNSQALQLKILISSLVLFLHFRSFSQEIIRDDSAINKWIHATVNISCFPHNTRLKNNISGKLLSGQISMNEYRKRIDSIDRNYSLRLGAAIFLKAEGRHYLLTAGHLLSDSTALLPNQICKNILLVRNLSIPDSIFDAGNFSSEDSGTWRRGKFNLELPETPYDSSFYIFSESGNDDLCIVDLDAGKNGKEFTGTLYQTGYIPVSVTDININCSIRTKQDILAIGYPDEAVFDYSASLPQADILRKSNRVSLPMVTKGQIASVSDTSNYFDSNIFVYKGNSGGPVIANNQLVGIVHGYSTNKIKSAYSRSLNQYVYWHAYMIKSSLILPLLKRLEVRTKALETRRLE